MGSGGWRVSEPAAIVVGRHTDATQERATHRLGGAEPHAPRDRLDGGVRGLELTPRRFDSDRNGTIDSYLPNNRIGAPYRGTLYGDYRFDNGAILRLEGEGFSGRDAPISTTGTRFPIDGAFIMNAALSLPWQGGQVYLGANNIFDTAYENPTATSVRNLPVFAWGRTVTLGYRKTW